MTLLGLQKSAVLLLGVTLVTMPPTAEAAPLTGSAAGIGWTVPETWSKGQGSSMRVATYAVPGAGDAEAGECAVFFFGRGQGGGVDENVARWARQFKENPEPLRKTLTVSEVSVTFVEIEGTYMNPGGGRMQSRGEKPNYKLLGAIVEAPGGRVFFKLTGPRETISQASEDFGGLISSVEKQ